MIKRALFILLPILVIGCGADREYAPQQAKDGGIAQSAPPPPPAPPSPLGSPSSGGGSPPSSDPVSTPAPAERQIIRSGDISLRIASLDSAERAVTTIATANNGYLSTSSRERSTGNAMIGTAQLRVPADKFQSVLGAVRRLGEVESERISANDVTEEYVDMNARLKTQQELEARILNLLNERSGKLSDIIEIEGKLADVRREIEGIQGRLRYLQGQISYSTLTVTMVEPGTVGTSQTETFTGRIGRAFSQGVDGLVVVLGGLITFIIAMLPLAALVLVAYLLIRPLWRRRALNRAAAKNAAQPAAAKTDPPATV